MANATMDNELLSLWIKAGAGLSRDDARELVQRLADEKAEHDDYCRELEAAQESARDALAEALAQADEAAEAWERRALALAEHLHPQIDSLPPAVVAVLREILG